MSVGVSVFGSSDYSKVAGSLATVAIASLGGPLAAVGAGLAEVVRYAQARYAADAPARDLRRQVTEEIRHWAEGEKLANKDIELGLALATDTVAHFGLDHDAIAALKFDPQDAAKHVLKAAKAKDRSWGKEDHYTIAERAIDVTYGALIKQIRGREPVLLPAIQALRSSIDDHAERVEAKGRNIQAELDDLVAKLIAAGTVAEVMSYLQARIADWDVSVWHPDQQPPSDLERPLWLRTTGREASVSDHLLTAEEALAGQRMLVVLGSPGSGKTWLARRYTREAAQAALSSLEDGLDLDKVELPLFTTWDQWTTTPGGLRESLVASSFAAGLGHSDPEGGDTMGRLQRTFNHPDRKVLAVVDSLDEAADVAGQANRLRELSSLHGWRVVVTSRPAAWDATHSGTLDRVDGRRVVELQELKYPEDVDGLIHAWFATDPRRGDALIKQIRGRHDLSRAAVIPLVLTFYCLLTEESAAADQPLPTRRRDLHRRLVRRLLRSKWATNAPGPDAAPDMEYCEALLTKWAWHAVRDRTTPTGLGDWADTFIQPTAPRTSQRRAIDHVAPKLTEDDEGEITRRFVHRIILEHFVAEYIASMDADDAAHVLLPHLWFDLDWTMTAPAAIAAHNRRQRGVLFQQLLDWAVRPATDPARQAAASEFERLLLAIAEESEPAEWTPDHQDVLDRCRVMTATSDPRAVVRSAHWNNSNHDARANMLAALPHADPYHVSDLVAALPALEPTDADRTNARAALLAVLTDADSRIVSDLVAALPALEPTDADRAKARAALLAVLPHADPQVVRHLVAALAALEPTDAERATACAALLATLRDADPEDFSDLVTTLAAVLNTSAEQAEARAALVAVLPHADPHVLSDLVAALPALGPTDAQRAEARAALLTALSDTESWFVSDQVAALPALGPTDAQRAEARAALLTALSNADPLLVSDQVAALTALDPTDAQRAEARAALVAGLADAYPDEVGHLVAALLALEPTDTDRAKARTALLAGLANADPDDGHHLVMALRVLEPIDADREKARSFLLAALPDAQPERVGHLVAALAALEPTDAERAKARATLLAALSDGDPSLIWHLVEEFTALKPTDAERATARATVLDALPNADPQVVIDLVAALAALESTDAERAKARTDLLTDLANADPWFVGDLVTALTALGPTDGERREAGAALLAALPDAYPEQLVSHLVTALAALLNTSDERADARAGLRAALPHADPWFVTDLVMALLALEPTDADRAEARAALLAALSDADPSLMRHLVTELTALEPTDADRAKARAALLAALSDADPQVVIDLVTELTALEPTDADRAKARAALLVALPAADPQVISELVEGLRSVSPVQLWIAWLAIDE